MEIRISKEDFMKIIKRVAKSMLGSVSALNASTITLNYICLFDYLFISS